MGLKSPVCCTGIANSTVHSFADSLILLLGLVPFKSQIQKWIINRTFFDQRHEGISAFPLQLRSVDSNCYSSQCDTQYSRTEMAVVQEKLWDPSHNIPSGKYSWIIFPTAGCLCCLCHFLSCVCIKTSLKIYVWVLVAQHLFKCASVC